MKRKGRIFAVPLSDRDFKTGKLLKLFFRSLPLCLFIMALFRVLCWALIFILRMRFPPDYSIATLKPNYSCRHSTRE